MCLHTPYFFIIMTRLGARGFEYLPTEHHTGFNIQPSSCIPTGDSTTSTAALKYRDETMFSRRPMPYGRSDTVCRTPRSPTTI